MSNYQANANNNSAGRETVSKQRIEVRLREAGVRVARSANVEKGIKACYNHENQEPPTDISGNYTVHGGDGLILLDVDVSSDDFDRLPDWVDSLPSTLVVESPHGGYHVYYVVEDDSAISNTQTGWGSIRYEGQYVVGPGSTIDHARCDDDKENCPGKGNGFYRIEVDKPIATLDGKHLDTLREACTGSSDAKEIDVESILESADSPNTDLVALGDATLHDLQAKSTPGFNAVMDFLQGGKADFEGEKLTKETGQIDRDTHDTLTFSLLYGTFRTVGDMNHDKAIAVAEAILTRYCREHPTTKEDTPQLRRWLKDGNDYRSRIINYAVNSFSEQKFKRLLNRGIDSDGFYGEINYRLALAVVEILCGEEPEVMEVVYGLDLSSLPNRTTTSKGMTPPSGPSGDSDSERRSQGSHSPSECPYPQVGVVAEILSEMDRNDTETFKNVLRELRREGRLKLVCIEEGRDYRICRPRHSEPTDADWVKVNGEEREPEPEPNGEETEPELVTDGGEPIEKETVELYTCPIDGCSRTVVGEKANLRHHVRQTTDEAHDGLALNGDLEVVELNDECEETESDSDIDSLVTPDIDEEAYHSTWGPGNQTEPNKPTVKSAAVVSW